LKPSVLAAKLRSTTSPYTSQLGGKNTVEVDETYCGGKPRPGSDKRIQGTGYRKDSNKIPVVAMVERGGEVRTKVIPKVNQKNLRQFLAENIQQGTVVNTDQSTIYHTILWPIIKTPGGRHDIVNHKRLEYIRRNPDGTVSGVNHCESFFSLLKRGLMGTFHCVSKEHLHRYCDEFAFRWNTRQLNDGDRLVAAIKNGEGKRLVYAEAKAA
jgi:transposase-like protein